MSINTDMKRCILLEKVESYNSLGQEISTFKEKEVIYMSIYKNKPRSINKAEVNIQSVVKDEFIGITSYAKLSKGMRIKTENMVLSVEDIITFRRKFQVTMEEVLNG